MVPINECPITVDNKSINSKTLLDTPDMRIVLLNSEHIPGNSIKRYARKI